MSKYAPIDIVKLYAGDDPFFGDDMHMMKQDPESAHIDIRDTFKLLNSHQKWNQWLTHCLQYGDMAQLMDVRYRLQVGMAKCAKEKLNTPNLNIFFTRLVRSIDNTAKKVIQKRQKTSNDLTDKKQHTAKGLEEKRQRDQEFEKYLKKISY